MKPLVLNKHCCGSVDEAVYIGRGSKWGNPFVIGKDGTRSEVIEKHRRWLATKPDLLASLHELRGKHLICFCAPAACHGDTLLELANRPVCDDPDSATPTGASAVEEVE